MSEDEKCEYKNGLAKLLTRSHETKIKIETNEKKKCLSSQRYRLNK